MGRGRSLSAPGTLRTPEFLPTQELSQMPEPSPGSPSPGSPSPGWHSPAWPEFLPTQELSQMPEPSPGSPSPGWDSPAWPEVLPTQELSQMPEPSPSSPLPGSPSPGSPSPGWDSPAWPEVLPTQELSQMPEPSPSSPSPGSPSPGSPSPSWDSPAWPEVLPMQELSQMPEPSPGSPSPGSPSPGSPSPGSPSPGSPSPGSPSPGSPSPGSPSPGSPSPGWHSPGWPEHLPTQELSQMPEPSPGSPSPGSPSPGSPSPGSPSPGSPSPGSPSPDSASPTVAEPEAGVPTSEDPGWDEHTKAFIKALRLDGDGPFGGTFGDESTATKEHLTIVAAVLGSPDAQDTSQQDTNSPPTSESLPISVTQQVVAELEPKPEPEPDQQIGEGYGRGRIYDDIGELRENKKEEHTFGMQAKTTNWFHVLLDVDDKLLSGFAPSTVARIGLGPGRGLHVRLEITAGQYTEAAMHFQFLVRNGADIDCFLDVVIPLNSVLDVISIKDLPTSSDAAMATLLAFTDMELSSLRDCSRKDKFEEKLAGADLSSPARLISKVSDVVRHMRFDVDWSTAFEIKNMAFSKKSSSHPEATRQIAEAVMAQLHAEEQVSISVWFYPEESFDRHWRELLSNIGTIPPPYARYLVDVRLGHTDLSYNNIGKLSEDQRPERPVPPVTIFHSGEHRTVALIAGAAEEQDMVDGFATRLRDISLDTVFIQDVFSTWQPGEDDLSRYGIPADGSILRFWMVTPLDEHVAFMMPEVGDRCVVYPDISTALRRMPPGSLSAAQVQHIVRDVVRGFHAGVRSAANTEDNKRKQIDKAKEQPDNDDWVSKLESELPAAMERAFVHKAAKALYDLLKGPSAEVADDPNYKHISQKAQTALTAKLEALRLKQREDEEDSAWWDRITHWVKTHATSRAPVPNTGLGPEWPAKRLPLPPGTQANIALFSVEVPRQLNWVPGLVKPYLAYKFKKDTKAYTPAGAINAFLGSIFSPPPTSPVPGASKRSTTRFKTIWARMSYEPRDRTIVAECDAITTMNAQLNAANRTWAGRFWGYSTDFSAQPANRDFVQGFPGLAQAYEDGVFQGETVGLVDSLRKVPFGWAFVTGGPGSGKTTAALNIVKAVTSQPPRPSDTEMTTDKVVDNEADGGKVGDTEIGNPKESTEDDALVQIVDGIEYTSPGIPPPPVENWDDVNANCAEDDQIQDQYTAPEDNNSWGGPAESIDNTWGTSTKTVDNSWDAPAKSVDNTWGTSTKTVDNSWDAPAKSVDNTWGTSTKTVDNSWDAPAEPVGDKAEPVVVHVKPSHAQASRLEQDEFYEPQSDNPFDDDNPEDDDLQYETPGGLQFDKAPKDISKQRCARVAWTAPQNKLVDDAVRRATALCKDKVVVRVLPWNIEMINVKRIGEVAPRMTETWTAPAASPASFALARHSDALRMASFEEKSPSHVFGSLSEFARAMAFQDPVGWEAVHQAWAEKDKDPIGYDLNKKKHDEAFRDLMIAAADKIDIACGTPVSMATFANKVPWIPQLVVIDESNRLSENMSVMPMTKWQNAFALFIGDQKQFPPMALAKDQREFRAVFCRQREISLFRRIEDNGRMLFTLRSNHRGRVGAAEWARDLFYGRDMSIAHRKHSLPTLAFMDWTEQVFKKRAQTLMILPPNSNELKVGTSYGNVVNSTYVTQLIVQMYRQCAMIDARDASLPAGSQRRASVLIVTPYAVQKNAYDFLIRKMSPAEIPKALVEVRTIDDSPSHEADVVIVDCVRTSKLGFIGNPQRLAVLMTRARIGTILIGPGGKVVDNRFFADLRGYIQDHDAIIDKSSDRSQGWDRFCDTCIQPGHWADRCPVTPFCTTCEAPHSTRDCPRAKDNAIGDMVTDEIRADDGIKRDINNTAALDTSGKRVKKNKADRQRQLAKPVNAQTEAQREFKVALREAEKGKEPEEGKEVVDED